MTTAGTLSNTGRLEGRRLALTAEALDNGGTLLGVDALTLAIAGTARNPGDGAVAEPGGRASDGRHAGQSGRLAGRAYHGRRRARAQRRAGAGYLGADADGR
nr:hypothetical protein [Dickeya chrysanthemi]